VSFENDGAARAAVDGLKNAALYQKSGYPVDCGDSVSPRLVFPS